MNDLFPVPRPAAAAEPRGAAILERTGPPTPCHRCGTIATVQWPRHATDAEAEQHWAAMEANIRSIPDLYGNQNTDYSADRTQAVVKAVFGCNDHDLSPEPATDHDGSDDAIAEAARAAKLAGMDARALTHDADCGGHGQCQCGGGA